MAGILPAQVAPSPEHHHHHGGSRCSNSTPSILSWKHNLTLPNAVVSSSLSLSSSTSRRSYLPPNVTCTVQPAASTNYAPGTPVRPTSILVVDATGTRRRQIVRWALDEGYDVCCLVRPRPAPADFLRDWGATVVNADLSKPESIPATLVGIHTVIDCTTGRPEEPIKTVDWEGKVALIQCAKGMGIQKFVFFSIHNCDKHPKVPLMEIKYCTEKFLQDSGLNHVKIRLWFHAGPDWAICCTDIGREICMGDRCAYTDSIYGYSARLTFIALRMRALVESFLLLLDLVLG